MCRILVVDEQALVRELVAEVLSQRGHEAVCADTEEEALAFLQENHVDVVLMDRPHARVGAPDLLSRLREDDRLRALPVVVIEDEGGSEMAGGGATEPMCEVSRMNRSRFRLDELLTRVDECLGLGRAPGGDRRTTDRVRLTDDGLAVHVKGMGPWRVVDVSAGGLGVVAGARLEIGEDVGVLLRDGTILYGGRMRVCNRVGCGGGRHRYGLEVVDRTSMLSRALGLVRMRLQREAPCPGAAPV